MTFGFISAYFMSMLACWIGGVLIEMIYRPKPQAMWKRSYLAIVINLLLLVLVYTAFLLISHRFLFSIGGTLILVIVILGVNNAKYVTLKEPLVFSDFFLYLQVFQHPRLYLPFLGLIPLAVLSILVVVVILSGVILETPAFSWLSLNTLFLFVVLGLTYYAISRLATAALISIDLQRDCSQFGIVATACIYAFQAPKYREELYQKIVEESSFSKKESNKALSHNKMTDIVVVQSESFFDARELSSNVIPEVLSEYDRCLASSEAFGKLKVPAWGANTMRSEFAFLTGLTPKQLGLAKFYPYQQLLKFKVPSIVGTLKSLGYHCVCIHPNASSFFMRDKFFKELGFDEFIDGRSFVGAVREGPYVADEAVTEKIKQVLGSVDKPCFIFAITMENHGPLHLETVAEDEWRGYYKNSPSSSLDDLTVYLRHLKNADRMVDQLCEYFSDRSHKVLFSLYGDHVPAIPKIFDEMSYKDSHSNYFIWSNVAPVDVHVKPEQRELCVEDLAQYLLDLR